MRGSEPLMEQLVDARAREHQPWMPRLAGLLYPVQERREQWEQRVQAWALDLVASSRDYDRIRKQARDIFSTQHLRVDQQQDFEMQEGAVGALTDWTRRGTSSGRRGAVVPAASAGDRADPGDRVGVFPGEETAAGTVPEPAFESASAARYQAALREYVARRARC